MDIGRKYHIMQQGQQLMPPNIPEQEDLRQQRRDARMQRKRQRRKARILLTSTVTTCVVLIGLLAFFFLRLQSVLNPTYPAINTITCDSTMHDTYHIHVHLTIYINGNPVSIPQGIGIAPNGSCYYWLHTHSSDGIIHVEAPSTSQTWLALDDFIAVWHNGFSNLSFPPQLEQPGWKLYLNGQPFIATTTPAKAEIRFRSHNVITLEYGTPYQPPDTPTTYHFPANLPQ
jgi:hypothetical protein